LEEEAGRRMIFLCDLCDREFSSLRGMKIHRENHSSDSFERRSGASKEVHSRLDVKERRTLNTRKTNALPETKLKRSLSGKISQNRPDVKAKIRETNSSPETKNRRRNAQILYNLRPGVKELKSEITKRAWLNPEIRKKYIEAQSNPKTKEKKSKSQTNAVLDGRVRPDRGINGFYNSLKAGMIWYRSSYELMAYQKLDFDVNVLTFDVEPFKIEYYFNNIKRNYVFTA
jgi:hypothetical protein